MTVSADAESHVTSQSVRPEPVERLPPGWARVSITEISHSMGGGTPSKSDASYWTDGTVPWVSPKDMKSFHIVSAEDTITESALKRLALIPTNSVLLVVRSGILSHTLPVGLNALPVTINQDMRAFVTAREISARYLAWQLVSRGREILSACSKDGTTVASIEAPALARFPLTLAPAAEQTRIVEKLEELLSDLDAGVAELKAAQKKLTQYRQSLLKAAVEGALTADWRKHNQPAESGAQLLERILKERRARWQAKQLAKFKEQGKAPPKDWQDKYPEPVKPDTTDLPPLPEGWVWASVEQIASDEQYSLSIGPFGSNLKVSDYRESGVPLVFVRNIRAGRYGGSNTKFVASDKADELKAHSTQAGDVLITKMGEPPGDADVYPADQPPAIITADCIKVRCWPALMEAQFLATVINSNIGKSQITPMTQGVAQKKVSLGRFSTLAVPLPSHSEQLAIVEMLGSSLSEAGRQGDAIALSLKQSTAQRKNILKAAFSGQLVPQDPNDEPARVLLARIRAERAGSVSKPRVGQRKAALADVI